MEKYDTDLEKMSIAQLQEFCELRYLEEQYAHEMRSEATAVLRRKLEIRTAEEALEQAQEEYNRALEKNTPQEAGIISRILERLGLSWLS